MTEDCGKSMEARLIRLETAFQYHREATEKALELQAGEYDRRLDALNGEAGRILEAHRNSVSREVFDVKVAELEKSIKPIAVVVTLASLFAATAAALLVKWVLP